MNLQDELASVINRHSAENGSNTPDFVLASYLHACLAAFDAAVMMREKWYGRELSLLATTQEPRNIISDGNAIVSNGDVRAYIDLLRAKAVEHVALLRECGNFMRTLAASMDRHERTSYLFMQEITGLETLASRIDALEPKS